MPQEDECPARTIELSAVHAQTAMGGTSSPPTQRRAWSVTKRRSQRCQHPQHSAKGMIRARRAIRHTRSPRRLRSGAPHATRRTQVLAQNKVRDHRDCSSCHEPHAVRAAGDAPAARAVTKTWPRRIPWKARGDCVSCHDPHPRRPAQVALQCSQCHEEARSESAFHAGKTVCTSCHQPHRFDLSNLSDRALCGRCHVLQIRLTRRNLGILAVKHATRGTTHEPAGLAACGTCHDDELSRSPARDIASARLVTSLMAARCRHRPAAPAVTRAASCLGFTSSATSRKAKATQSARPATTFTKPRCAPIAQPA